jgi:cyclase
MGARGRPMRPAEIEFPLRYLREPDSGVSRAVDEGRSVEATLEAVAMSQYGDYSLFEWVHNSVNVPAAYQHLQDLRSGEA